MARLKLALDSPKWDAHIASTFYREDAMTKAEQAAITAEQDEAWGNAAPTDAEMEAMYEALGQSTAPELTDDDLNANYIYRRSVRGSR